MKHKVILMIAGVLVFSGCGSTSQKMTHVQLMKNDPPAECRMVGDIQSEGDDMNEAKNELRVKADELGGDYVRLDALDMSGGDAIAAGAAFKCQQPEPTALPEPTVPPKVEPDKTIE
jgi:hypothetical protein